MLLSCWFPSSRVSLLLTACLPACRCLLHRPAVRIADRYFKVFVTAEPGFGSNYDQNRSSAIVLGLCVGLAVLAIMAIWFMASLCFIRDRQQRAMKFSEEQSTSAQMEASRQAHNGVVSYICHGLRNPMHVVTACSRMLCEENAADPLLTDERHSIVQDVFGALAQMRATVDNVLNFRTVRGGLCVLSGHAFLQAAAAAAAAEMPPCG